MKVHTRHVALALFIALLLLIIATVAARAQVYSGLSGAQLYARFWRELPRGYRAR